MTDVEIAAIRFDQATGTGSGKGTMQLDPVELRGSKITLEPVGRRHHDELQIALHCDEEGWAILPRSGFGDAFPAFWNVLSCSAGRLAYAVRDRATGRTIGTSSFVDVDSRSATLEIGGTWLRPEFRGTSANPETKLLMLTHAFDAGAERVQFKVDTRNVRSLGALARLGATHEGIIRKHLVTWTGFRRDSALSSILSAEWPSVRARLLDRLSNKNKA